MNGNKASSKPIPIYRPKEAGWWLARSSPLVQAAVKQLDDSADGKVLLSNILNAPNTKGGLKLWALQLQTITHIPNGNYLNQFFGKLHEKMPEIARKLAIKVSEQGVSISPWSGHFTSLEHLDPNEPVPRKLVNREVGDMPYNRSVDNFTPPAKYDLAYKPRSSGVLSEV